MRTRLTIAVFALALIGSVWADQTQTNTAAKAAEAALAFFPHSPSGKVPQSTFGTFGTPFQSYSDVTEPAAAVQRQYRLGLDSLQAGKSTPYLALLAQDYQQSGADKAETARRLADLLASNRCDSASFCITDAHMDSTHQLTVRVWQEFVFTSKNTPPTHVMTAGGKTFTVNNTGRLTVTQTMREEWVRTEAGWQMRRAETLAQKAAAVL